MFQDLERKPNGSLGSEEGQKSNIIGSKSIVLNKSYYAS